MKVSRRLLISTPTDILNELSPNSFASECYAKQKFSRDLQRYLVDYSLTTAVTPLILTDVSRIKIGDKYEL